MIMSLVSKQKTAYEMLRSLVGKQKTAYEMLRSLVGSEMCIRDRALGAPPAVVGLVEGVAEATAAAGKAISGRLADVRRRVPLVAWGYGISAVAKPLIGMATGWPLVLVAYTHLR